MQSPAPASQEGAAAESPAPGLQDEPTEVPDEGAVAEPEPPTLESPAGEPPADTPAEAEPPADTPAEAEPPAEAPIAPYRLTFAADEPIDVSPAAVFANTDSGEITVWAIPDAVQEIAVAPSGNFILWWEVGTHISHLLRTDSGIDRVLAVDIMLRSVREFGPNDAGFVAIGREDSRETIIFDAFGHLLVELQDEGAALTAWAPDGRTFAYAWGNTLHVTVLPEAASDPPEMLFTILLGAVVGLDWASDNERLAVVTQDTAYAFDRAGDELWQTPGEFYRNPRWSPDGQLLIVAASNPDSTYVFDRAGNLIREVEDANTCQGNLWAADSSGFFTLRAFIRIADRVPDAVGYLVQSPVDVRLVWAVERTNDGALAIVLHDRTSDSARSIAIVAGEQSIHLVHTDNYRGDDVVAWTSDGTRIVFTIPAGQHDGCL